MTSLRGSSRPLSTPEDRERFHSLRKGAKAILIGGATFRAEPYQNLSIPLFIATRKTVANALESPRGNQSRSGARLINVSPAELVRLARKEIPGDLLIEGGINFLNDLIESRAIDQFHITRVKTDGDALPFNEQTLQSNYRLISKERVNETTFELWHPLERP
jgi:riboflavin biosynthesis pyrimidine reductase